MAVRNPAFILERALWRRGFQDPMLRTVLVWQTLVMLLALLAGLACLLPLPPLGWWLIWFAFGAALADWNFYALARFTQRQLAQGWKQGVMIRMMLFTNVRLIASAVLLYLAFVRLEASLTAMLAGIGSLLVGITVEGLKKILKNPV